jgi:hypothetical protein
MRMPEDKVYGTNSYDLPMLIIAEQTASLSEAEGLQQRP